MKRHIARSFVLLLLCIPAVAFGQAVNEVFSFSSAHSSPGPIATTPAQGRDGAIYGTTSGLGLTVTAGAVYRIAGTPGRFTALHDFTGPDGKESEAGLTLGIDGNYYGTTTSGGNSNAGVLFKVTPSGSYTILYEFTGGSDGANPYASPIQASDGNFYGTTDGDSDNAGVIYRYTPSSGAIATIFSFKADYSQGGQIFAPLIQGADGNLYGMAQYGGANLCGTIFELSISGALLQLYSFPCGTGGNSPAGPLVQASDGNFYGTTELGGVTNSHCVNGCGTVFKMSGGVVSILYSFSGPPNDSAVSLAGLVEATDGNLYGTTSEGGSQQFGTLYQISKSGQYKLLYSFFSNIGRFPSGNLLQHTNGKFYGTAFNGGATGEGSLYSLNMGLSPFISLVRYTGRIGQPVQILGQGLTGSTAVTINGIPATSFKVVSDTYMTAVVPAGATVGPVIVTTTTGTLTSNHNFRVVQ